MKAKDLIQKNDSAIVLFTRGPGFSIHDDKTGTTGNWVMSPNRHFDKVIIYLRGADVQSNDVYVAVPTGVVKSPEDRRYIVEFKAIDHVGTTSKNWVEFAEGGQGPIRYIDPHK